MIDYRKEDDIMLKINYEFRKGIFFIRLIGDLDKNNYYKQENFLEELISYNGFKQVVINTDLLRNVDIYGINYLINFNKILRSKNTNLVLCDKTNIWRTLFFFFFQHINNELEVFNG